MKIPMKTALINATLFTGKETLTGKALLIQDGFIKAVIDPSQIPETAEIIDLTGLYLAPGLIDLQIYGSSGQLFSGKPPVEALEQMENDLLAWGCTGFLATVATNSPAIVEQAIASGKAYRKKAKGNFLGLHLEGPYLNPKRKGAHPERFIKKASLQEVKSWLEKADGEIKMMTLAPELQDQEVIDYLHSQGVALSAGHSDASYEEAVSFLNNPVKAATHLYNAMPPIHHRKPGLVPAIFKQKPYTSIVADGIHVSFAMIELAKRELGDKLFLITDAVTQTKEGIYPHVFAEDHYTMPDGTLSGSCLTMLMAVKNCVEYAGIELAEVLNMASLIPAQVINMEHETGKMQAGYKANLIIFNKNLEVHSACLAGVYA